MALLLPHGAHAAAYVPGALLADPPTGENPAPPLPPPGEPAGNGVRWEFAPWRSSGSVTADMRWLRLEDGRRSAQAVVFVEDDFASYVWQPWFIQVRAGVGLLLGREASGGAQEPADSNSSASMTGRFAMAVFPASRYPFELRADLSDSRTGGDTLGADYRSARLSLSQAYRPETGNDHYHLNIDHSRLTSDTGGSDTLTTFNAAAQREFTDQSMALGVNLSQNERSDSGDNSRLGLLSLRHSYHPRPNLLLETLATWNDTRLQADAFDLNSQVRQVSTFGTWRPGEGDPLYSANAPLSLAGSARWVEASGGEGSGLSIARAFSATLGAIKELSREWRVSGSSTVGELETGGRATKSATAGAAVYWTPASVELGNWRWVPDASANVGLSHTSTEGSRALQGLQGSQTVSRDWALDEQQSLSLSLSQGAAVLHESPGDVRTRSLAPTASLYWQAVGDGGRQSFAGLSLSEARSWARESGRFQLVNLQWSQRLRLSRYSGGAANLTLQATRNDTTLVDAFTGQRRDERSGWQRYYTAAINFDQQRFLGVPGLRYSLLVSANSQQLDRRAFGDIDAPTERISESVENRLDYTIGRLETRLSARVARVEDRWVAALLLRAQRRF